MQDPQGREAVLAWAEARGWQVGWRSGDAHEPDKESSVWDEAEFDLVTGALVKASRIAGASALAGSRGVAKALGGAGRRDRHVELPAGWQTACAPVVDDAVRAQLRRSYEEGMVDRTLDIFDVIRSPRG